MNMLKNILDDANLLYKDKKPSAYSLKALIEKYNECKPQTLPQVAPFDDGADVASDYGSIGGEGFYKLTKIRMELAICLNATAGNPATKIVSDFAEEIAREAKPSAYSLKAIIEKYNKCKPQDLPDVDSFNDRTDVSSDYASIGGEGFYKLTKIRLELSIYLKSSTGIPAIKVVSEFANEIAHTKSSSAYSLKAIIEKYNKCKPQTLPQVAPFDEGTDSDGIYIAGDGFTKLETIRLN